MKSRLYLVVAGGLALAAGAALFVSFDSSRRARADDPSAPASGFSPYVAKDGSISLPTDYREKFVHLGTYAVSTKPGQPVDELHNVYSRLEDVAAYRKEGRFPDGAILVKDVMDVDSGPLTTGDASWSKDVKIWFVMVKDAERRFPDNELWGDGWGWALFEAKDPKKNVATDYTTDCKACHVPAKKTDWVYVHGYPILEDPADAE